MHKSVVTGAIAVILIGGSTGALAASRHLPPWMPGARHNKPGSVQNAAPPVVPPPPPQTIPASTLPVPTPPYNAQESHPLSIKSVPTSMVTAAIPHTLKRQGPLTITTAWYINSSTTVIGGDFQLTSMPALVILSSSGPGKFISLTPNGAPGPIYIKGVKGPEILLLQGYGYEVLNDRTDQIAPSNQNADVLTH